jgi:hypothetical protein
MENRISLSREELLQLRELIDSMPKIESVLVRHADDDPEAKRLHLALFSGGARASSRKIYLGAGDTDTPPLKRDFAGHALVDYDGAPKHCLQCSAVLLAAGDVSIGHEGRFAESALHDAIQRYVLAHPGTSYVQALESVAEEERAFR